MKKYELTDESKKIGTHTLFRIKALKDFTLADGKEVKAGDLGGWIEQENNLSQNGCCWVYGDARVYGNAWVSGDARVSGNAWVSGDARVYGDARVSGNAWVSGDARVSGDAVVMSEADILMISNIGSRFGTTTIFKNKNGGIDVSCGCFFGSLQEFESAVEKTHGANKYGQEYRAVIDLAKIHMEVKQ